MQCHLCNFLGYDSILILHEDGGHEDYNKDRPMNNKLTIVQWKYYKPGNDDKEQPVPVRTLACTGKKRW
jgi:hypothetical protein